ERLYDSTVAPLVEEMLEGFNCTIFAYGQTGTGKTYTMTGGDLAQGSAEMTDSAGVIPRAIHQVFSYLESLGAQEFTVKASYLELYNEEVTDLLALGSEPPKVRILEDRTGVVLNGLEEAQVRSASDIFSLLDQGTAKRRTAETLLNKQSSRSHTVFVITVSVREILAEGEEVIRVGKLYLVDLAGSENITRSGAVEQRAKEAGNINKSLLTLGRVITALVEGQGHVPYRDSKLTRLLRDSLGGRTKTCIIATIAPTVQCQEETLSTLEYAHRAKNIKNKPEINQKISKTTHLKEMNVEIEKLKLMLNATREKNGVYIPTAQYDEECEERKFLNGRVLELEEAAEASGAQHEAEKAELAAAAESQRQVLEQRLEEVGRCGVVSGWVETRDGKPRNMWLGSSMHEQERRRGFRAQSTRRGICLRDVKPAKGCITASLVPLTFHKAGRGGGCRAAWRAGGGPGAHRGARSPHPLPAAARGGVGRCGAVCRRGYDGTLVVPAGLPAA
ncbi:125 kDa kinesin-related protein, partial [Auxenochlorella protothecoides]